jgi:predicted nucleic acid-binding protein
MRGDVRAEALLQSLLESPDPLGISPITVMQLYHGVARVSVPEAEAERIERALKGVATYDFTRDIAVHAGRLDGELATRGETLDPGDVIIGATALHRSEPVVTRNTRDFSRLRGLRIITY